MKKHNVIIDTNVWISFFLKAPIEIYNFITDYHLQVFSCQELRNELEEVMERKKFQKYFSKQDRENALFIFDRLTKKVDVSEIFSGSPDPKDDFLFALAKQTNAKFLIIGDKKLQEFNTNFIKIISLNTFKELL